LQIPWNLPVKLSIYAKDRYSVVFPVLTKYPCCSSTVELKRHGFYERNALADNRCYRISMDKNSVNFSEKQNIKPNYCANGWDKDYAKLQ
jgi:hypothetical protein